MILSKEELNSLYHKNVYKNVVYKDCIRYGEVVDYKDTMDALGNAVRRIAIKHWDMYWRFRLVNGDCVSTELSELPLSCYC